MRHASGRKRPFLYIYIMSADFKTFKVGAAEDVTAREPGVTTNERRYYTLFVLRCDDAARKEKQVHHELNDYNITLGGGEELFRGDFPERASKRKTPSNFFNHIIDTIHMVENAVPPRD